MALTLAVAIIGLFLFYNRQYIFHTEIYENNDWAANSLLVRDAGRGLLLHGHYSRWNFYHPGPALLDTDALGEAVFYHWLHLVPTPYNGQIIAVCVVMTLFFSFALAVFAQGLGGRRGGHAFFLPLALLFAIWHYNAAIELRVFLETWPGCTTLLPFLCFLVAAASTASGSGRELPLIALSGGWLVHNHVAQPLFVVPITLVAYAGLLVSCRRGEQNEDGPGTGPGRWLAAGWRTFPRSHVVAGIILGVFILPLVLDALHGRESNLSAILDHMHRQHGPHKTLVRSLCYFLTYGSYTTYDTSLSYFGRYSAAGMFAFVTAHWRPYLCWVVALVAPPVLFASARRIPSPASATPERGGTRRQAASTFIPWFYAMTALAFVLTLVWGIKQDGTMEYFNAYFDYSIYFCVALGLAAALAGFLQALTAAPGLADARAVLRVSLWLGATVAAVSGVKPYRDYHFGVPADVEAARSVTRAAAETLPPGSVCFMDCDDWSVWPAAISVALQLDRLGYKVRVSDNAAILFGKPRTITNDPSDLSRPIVYWKILPIARDPVPLSRYPLIMNAGILIKKPADLDPASGRIRFAADGNFNDYAPFGWSPTAGDFTLSNQRGALLLFRPLPLPAEAVNGVEMLIEAWSFTDPKAPKPQRVEIMFNGVALGTVQPGIARGPGDVMKVHIDAALWRDAAVRQNAVVGFRFPDATSPYALGLSEDRSLYGGYFVSIAFQTAR